MEKLNKQILASNFKCNVKGCKKQAVVFVGLNDPDGTEYPKWATIYNLGQNK